MSLRDTLKGTGVALVTPFNQNQEVDFEAYERLIDFVLDRGVEYLVILGTTGEAPTINRTEKIEIINYTFQKVQGRAPVVIGIGGNNTREVVHDLETYPLEKATAILSASPYYNKPSQEGLFNHYKLLSEAAPKPLILYNVPGRTASNITAETTIRLAKECPNVMGIKEASGNMIQCFHILKNRPAEFLVTSGDDHLALSLIAAGMDGVISVAANCFPRDFSEFIRLTLASEYHSAKHLLYKMLVGFDLLFIENNPSGVKAMLAEMGVIENYLRLPLVPLSESNHQKVREFLEEYGRL